MVSVHRSPSSSAAYELCVKGASEAVLPRCIDAGSAATQAATAAARGMRVLALARRPLDALPSDPDVAATDLELVALVALRDPVRPAAARSVAEARAAGITVMMATGDHAQTATAVAEEVRLAPPLKVQTGREVRAAGFEPDLTAIRVYARLDPDQKLDLVRALQARGHVVAMTGDGVNDAPALRQADSGVALAARGSDVARGGRHGPVGR